MVEHQIEESKKPSPNKYTTVCAVIASMASILVGYDIGVMSGAGMYIKEDLKISEVKLEIMSGKTLELVGRRYTMVIAAGIFFAGAFFVGFATNYGLLTTEGTFFIFAGFTTISVVPYYLILPETLGRTLEETESLFRSYIGWRTKLEMKKAEKTKQV